MKLTVIIPVYRVEATLERCIGSVVNQKVDDMEVILVDDGSPDRCGLLCDEWAERDHRIRVIHKQNGGLSDARNAGLDVARGEYVTFVDSDDYLAEGTYAPLLERIGEADLLEYAIDGRLTPGERTYERYEDYWLKERAYCHTYAWNKIYRRGLFDGIRYPKGKIFEDVYTLPQLLKKARRIGTTSHGAYHYCYNPEGITATADGNGLAQLLEAYLCSGMPVSDDYYLYLLNIQMDVCELTGRPAVLSPRRVDAAAFGGRKKLKALANNILGINILCKTNKLLHRFKNPSRW
jgi:glycosyltransferase involved in cell wall biosynthesis